VFITVYLVVATMVAVNSVQLLLVTHDFLSWTGVFLTAGPMAAFIVWIMVFRNVARTRANMPAIFVLGVLGLIMSIAGYFRGGVALAPIMASIGFGGYLVYIFWYSSFGRQPSPQLAVGAQLPDFELKDVEGTVIRSGELTDKPAVWISWRSRAFESR
jgi:hypothetical protein